MDDEDVFGANDLQDFSRERYPTGAATGADAQGQFLRRRLHPVRDMRAHNYPKPPKRPLSTFTCFVRFYLRQYNRSMRRQRDGRAVMQVLRENYACMPEGHREYFDAISKETKNRYKREVAEWKQRFRDQGRQRIPRIRKKSKADPRLPRRPLNPFLHYFHQRLPEYKRTNYLESHRDAMKAIGAEWRKLSADQKKPYVDRARESLATYKSIMTQLKEEKKELNSAARIEKKVARLKKLRELYSKKKAKPPAIVAAPTAATTAKSAGAADDASQVKSKSSENQSVVGSKK